MEELAQPLPTGTSPNGGANECQRDIYEAKRVELNVLLLVDVSGSMLGKVNNETLETQWEAVRDAMQTFIESPGAEGLGVSLAYFPVVQPRSACTSGETCTNDTLCIDRVCMIPTLFDAPIPCATDADCPYEIELEDGTRVVDSCAAPNACNNHPLHFCFVDENCPNDDTCNVEVETAACPGVNSCASDDYESAAVPLQVLPEGRDALLESLAASYIDPYANTPTHIALDGAFTQLRQWQEDDRTRRSVLILATDGVPSGCESLQQPNTAAAALDLIAEAAEAELNTFVIGVLPTVNQADPDAVALIESQTAFLGDMAAAGLTETPFLVEANVDTAQRFLDALDQIRSAALPCDYELPSNTRNFDQVNIEATTGDQVTTLPKVDGQAACSGDGWYYDADETAADDQPTRAVLCPSSCAAAKESRLGRIDIVLGCPTIREAR